MAEMNVLPTSVSVAVTKKAGGNRLLKVFLPHGDVSKDDFVCEEYSGWIGLI
jgi:hypothetical protein